jgi:hypothetical protein
MTTAETTLLAPVPALALAAVQTEPTGPQPVAVPLLRLVPAPASAPPYDDEIGPAPVLRLVMTPTAVEPVPVDDEAWFAAARTPSSQLPAAQVFARTLVQGVLEVLAGVRSIKQLQRDTTPELYATLSTAISRGRCKTGPRPDQHAVRSLHAQERPEGIVEVCATVVRGTRMGALALRLEGLDGRWTCTELVGIQDGADQGR